MGIGISAIGSCVLPVDANGQPLRPAILYGIDTRAIREIEYLEAILGKEEIFEKSGMYLSSQASGPKILWIKTTSQRFSEKPDGFLPVRHISYTSSPGKQLLMPIPLVVILPI